MIEAPRHLIKAGPGRRIRVLRLVAHAGHTYPLRYHATLGAGCCRVCGCTDRYGCPQGCAWLDLAKRDLCTRCAWRIMR